MTATNSQTAGTAEGRTLEGRLIGNVISSERLVRAENLRKAGFVHITGLPVSHPGDTGQSGDREHIIQTSRQSLSRADANNGKVVVITIDGEVWLAINCENTRNTAIRFAKCEGAFVPCSNGETIHMSWILERLVDPYSDCGGRYSPIPNLRD